MRTTIVIPSLGRAEILGETLTRLAAQVVMPKDVLVVVTTQADLPDHIPDFVSVLFSEKGSCRQRNMGIDQSSEDTDFILFMDDDTLLHQSYIQEMEAVFDAHPDVAGLSGQLLKNGGVSIEEADQLLQDDQDTGEAVLQPGTLYGCNCAVRKSMLHGIRFDERLVLYGWLEDADLAGQLKRHGSIMYAPTLVAIHLMYSSGGRTNHIRFGYSQVMNPYYLSKKNKDLLSFKDVLVSHWAKAIPKNGLGMLSGPDRKMRTDRFKGNLIALGFVLRGKIEPEYASEL